MWVVLEVEESQLERVIRARWESPTLLEMVDGKTSQERDLHTAPGPTNQLGTKPNP